jgi:branched-chain amino acid transport system permease protein
VLQKFLQTLIDTMAVGSLYALIALGYTMVYGILKFINFAHSDVFVLGAWVAFTGALAIGISDSGAVQPVAPWVMWAGIVLPIVAGAVWAYEAGIAKGRARTNLAGPLGLAAVWGWGMIGLLFLTRAAHGAGLPLTLIGGMVLLLSMGTCGLVGFSLERLAYKPLRKAPRLNVLITAIGVSLLLQNTGQLNWMFGTRPVGMPKLLPSGEPLATVAGVKIWLVDVIGAATAVVLMIALDRLVFASKLGRAMRAVSYNTNNAALMGINVDRVISTTFVIGTALAGAAGFLWVQKYSGLNQTAHNGWVLLGLKAFVAAVVGGIGNIRGAMLGGLLIAALELFGAAYVSTVFKDVYVFALLIVVLLVRPTGIFGSTVREKV